MEVFGTRRMGGTVQPQSYCRPCRNKPVEKPAAKVKKPKSKPVARVAAKPAARATTKPNNVISLHTTRTTKQLSKETLEQTAQDFKDREVGRQPADPETKAAIGGKWKFCNDCGVEQPVSNFRERKDKEKVRAVAWCKPCEKERQPAQKRTRAEASRARYDK